MKILYGITKSNMGGAQRYVFDLARSMQALGQEVAVTCGGSGSLVERLGHLGIRTYGLHSLERDVYVSSDMKTFFEIFRILRREKPDVLHLNSSKMGGLGALAGRLVGTQKIIFTGHGWAFNESRSLWQKMFIKLFVWCTILLSHQTICVSEKTKKDVENLPFVKNKLRVIYNGIDEFSPDKEELRELLTVGTIAELHKIKGLDILLEAWGRFTKGNSGKLIIIGDGEERSNLEKMAKESHISGSVEFAGFVHDARNKLPEFDIFVLPSRSEAMPYVILEAGLASRAVIATRVGGISEIIEDKVDGLLVPKENVHELAEAIKRLSDDRELREKLSGSLHTKIETEFSLERMVHATLEVYERV